MLKGSHVYNSQPKRGRPSEGGRRSPIQKHLFMDRETAAMLKALAQGNESAWLRSMIQTEYRKLSEIYFDGEPSDIRGITPFGE